MTVAAARVYAGLLEMFCRHCEASARAYAIGKLDLIPTIDALQDFAFTRDVIEMIGQDAVQLVMAEAFLPVRIARGEL